jgi:hypothetical protein
MADVPALDLIDETYLACDRARVAAIVADPRRWQQWWPDLTLTVFMDRGPEGIRWNVAGPLAGSAEIWLEPVADGVLLHHYLRVDPTGGELSARRLRRLARKRTRAWKRAAWALKDELEAGRAPGAPLG